MIETNLMGQVHGARAALRQFYEQRAAVLIDVSSVWGRVSSPYVSPYRRQALRALLAAGLGALAGLAGAGAAPPRRRPG